MEKWEESGMIAQGIWIILILVFVLVFSMVLLARENFQRIARVRLEEQKVRLEHQQRLLEANIQVQEMERTRIAADIHDILIGKLTVLKIKNEIGYDSRESDSLIKDCIKVARRISHDLSLPMLEYSSLDELISEIMSPYAAVFNINLKMDVRDTYQLSDSVKIQLTRIVQELITNVVKHASATKIGIHLRHSEDWLFLIVKDDGKGFDISESVKGLGLKNIEFRIDYIKGKYRAISSPQKGTSYLFVLGKSEFR